MHPAIRFLLRGMAALLAGLVLAFVLAGCGGGGSEEEAPEELHTVPPPWVICAKQPELCT